MKKIKKIISGFVLLSLIVLNTGVNFTHIKKAQADGEILVSVAPSVSNVSPGESFTVDIVVNPQGIDDILAIQTNFEFDPSLVQADSVTLTELADPLWSDSCDPSDWCSINNVAGIIGSWISVFPSTTFTLLTIGMTAKTGVSGESYLRLPDSKHGKDDNDLLFVGSDFRPLPYDQWPYDLTNGSITVVASDAISPAITGISSTASDGLYKAGQTIAITAAFDENVTVAGTPQITLETGATDRTADYASGTETNVLTFNYTIQSGDTSNDLDYPATNSLSLNGGAIKDAAGNDAALTLPNPGEAGSLGANKDIAIDAVLPAIESYTLNGQSESATFNPNLGEQVEIAMNASESVDWTSVKIENIGDSGIYKYYYPGTDCDGKSLCSQLWNGSLSAGTLVDGEYRIKVNIKDAAENVFNDYLSPYTITVETNSPHVMQSVTLSPDPAYTNTDLTASPIADDPDSDPIRYFYKWNKNGSEIEGQTSQILPSSEFNKGDVITVAVTPNDGIVDGIPMTSANLAISNSAPTQPAVSISPDPAYTGDNLTCNASGSVDADGDAIEYLYQWYKDEVLQENLTSGVVESSFTEIGETWKCKVAASDGADNSVSRENSVVISEALDAVSPVITLLGNNPVNLYAGETYTDAGAAALDNIDGDITSNIITVNPVNTAAAGTYVITYNVSDSAGNPAQQTTRTVAILPVEQGQAPIEQSMTVSANAPEILIGDNAPSSAIINVPSEVANARLNVSALVSGDSVKSAVIPLGLTVNSSTSAGEVNLQIPQGIQINGGSSWTGEINLPQIKENSSVNIIPDSGYSAETSLVIEIGFGDVLLNFNKAVRIKIAGQAGKYAGYSRNGVFTQITNICSADSQAAGDALPEGAECKIDVGSDLIIWTKHFTKFATYMQTAIVSAPASTGGGGIIYNYSAAIDYQRLAEKTIGALAKEKISVKNTGTGRLNPGTLAITFSAEYLALNLANLNWKSYDSNTGIAIWETPALDYAKEYILDIELLPLRAGQNIITSLAYHTINTDTLASIADAIEPAAEETPANAASEDESAAAGASASEEINESGISAQSSTTETFYMEGATSASSSWAKNKETTEISDRTAAEEETEESRQEDNLTNELSETGTESEEGEVKGIESDKENLVEEGNKESKEKESKNIKEIIQGVISGYWWLGALMIIFGSLGYYYLGRGRSGGKL